MDTWSIPAEAIESVNDELADTRLALNWFDVRGDSFVITDLEPVCNSNLNRLLSVSPTNPYAATGQYLASLENLYSLPQVDWQIPTVLPAIDVFDYLLREHVKSVALPSPVLTFDQILAIFAHASKDPSHLAAPYVAFISFSVRVAACVRDLAMRMFLRHLRSTRRRVHRSVARFCAFSWARRVWYLLHGSHPPKSECRLAFGRA
jgi:hypothetical protein